MVVCMCLSGKLCEHGVHGLNDAITVLLGHHHRGLQLYDVAMDAISQQYDLMIQQHSETKQLNVIF